MKRGEFCGFFFPKEEEEFVRVIPDCEEAKHVYVSFLSKAVTLIDYATERFLLHQTEKKSVAGV